VYAAPVQLRWSWHAVLHSLDIKYINLPLFKSEGQTTTPTNLPSETKTTDYHIAEILAPINIQNYEPMGHYHYTQRELDSQIRRVDLTALTPQEIEAEARRRVRERNRREELRFLEEDARRRIENDMGSGSTTSGGWSGSSGNRRPRLVVRDDGVVMRDYRCANCHGSGHRYRDCNMVIAVQPGLPRRRHSVVEYVNVDRPRGYVRYVNGARFG
jgi:hypothetical protein